VSAVVCKVEDFQPMRSTYWSPAPPRERWTYSHEGPCRVGLYLKPGLDGADRDGAWFLRRAIEWAEPLAEFDGLVDAARRLLDLPVFGGYYVHPDRADLDAAREVVREASDYWLLCDYANDYLDEEDRLLGVYADGFGAGFLACWHQPGDVTKTVETLTSNETTEV
jgi:hypothetical protein